MKRAPRFPSRWAGWTRSLTITATLMAALGACPSVDDVLYGAREGTMEYPGSAAGPNAVPEGMIGHLVRDELSIARLVPRQGSVGVAELRENLARLAPDVIALGNVGCAMQIRQKLAIPVVHTVELLDWATGGPRPRELSHLT